jgi:hypothetical protein
MELNGKGQAAMSRAKIKRFVSTHYLLVGSAVAGECFLDKDGNIIVLRLAKGTSLSWRDQEGRNSVTASVRDAPSSAKSRRLSVAVRQPNNAATSDRYSCVAQRPHAG